tara:strand:+ start:409 stop:588 length:180 start_codon:yes stop_codon:yes gene_type:complete
MDFDSYLMKVYGFDTKDKKYKRMTPKARRILRESFAMDMQQKNDDKKLATLYPSNKQTN